MIEVKNTKTMGRGMFATESIKKGTIVNVSEVLIMSHKEVDKSETLSRYVFHINKKHCALALGHGSLFNHSTKPNVEAWIMKRDGRTVLEYKATKAIKKNEQLFINYGKYYPWER